MKDEMIKLALKNNLSIKLGIIILTTAFILGLLILGFTFGIKFFMAVGLFLVSLGVVNALYTIRRNWSIIKIIRYALIAFTIFFIISFSFVQLAIMTGSSPDNIDAEYVIILGAGLSRNEPSFLLRQRLDVAVEHYMTNPEVIIIVSGGKGQGESISEAEAMEKYLIQMGVDKSNIVKEDKSTNTEENIVNSKVMIDSIAGDKNHEVLLITSEYHLFRAKHIARENGYIPYGLPSKTPILIRVNYSIQEYFSIVKMYIRSFLIL